MEVVIGGLLEKQKILGKVTTHLAWMTPFKLTPAVVNK